MYKWIDMLVTLTLAKLGSIIEDKENLPYKMRELLPLNNTAEVEAAKQYYKRQIDKDRREGMVIPFERLCEICEYDKMAESFLQLALTVYIYPRLKELFLWMGRDGELTLELVQELFFEDEEEIPDYNEIKRSFELLGRLLQPSLDQAPFMRKSFVMDERIYSYLLGQREMAEEVKVFLNHEPVWEEQILWIHERQAKELEDYFLEQIHLLHIRGDKGVGKRHLVRYICQKYDFPLIEINGRLLGNLELKDLKEIVWQLRREMLLQESAICIYGIEQETRTRQGWDPEYFLREVVSPLLEADYPVFICSDTKTNLAANTGRFVGQVELEPLDRLERYALWKGFSNLWQIEGLEEEVLSSKFKLNAKEISKAAARLAFWQTKEALTEERIYKECMFFVTEEAMGTLKKEKSPQTLEELKLPRSQKDIISHIVSHVTYRYQVYDQWGLEKKYPYGKTVSALFTGPPGTGKTMAAHVIANMLKLPLYSVDLSQVVDKYIGETQKRLEEIFVAAERSSSILFFDEADAVFGKRSEVNDSKDRYANSEVAYILQRMEKYDGVVIMASNLQKNIDEAFMRRIRYLVHFEMPDEAVRKELWEGCFTEDVPRENIDFDFLAKTFEFSGGSIKNVVLNAAFLAAEEKTKIGMSQLIRSIRHEYIKQGKSIFIAEFGAYGYFLRT